MALAPNEVLSGGEICDRGTGAVVVTFIAAGAKMTGGVLRDADGRKVIVRA